MTNTNLRLKSLDTLRGLTVILMIIVNASTVLGLYLGYEVFDVMLHAEWTGLTLGDFVFPCFIFMVGVSVAYSLGKQADSGSISLRALRATGLRVLKLLVLGIVLFNLDYIMTMGESQRGFRLMGVLQRIAFCFFFAVLLYVYLKPRTLAKVVVFLLVVYSAVLFIPRPDGEPTDLLTVGANFVAWFDIRVLGDFVPRGMNYDPEGILSTIPAIAQCLIGVLAGDYMRRREVKIQTVQTLLYTAAGLLLSGLLIALFIPVSKPMWSPSFVLVTSGLSLVSLAILYYVQDIRKFCVPGEAFCIAFGVNAIFAYALHILVMSKLALPQIRSGVYGPLNDLGILPEISTFVVTFLFVLILWIPLWVMFRKQWIIKV